MNNDIFICSCHNTEHQLIFSYDEDGIVYVTTHLTSKSFWKRIINGIKYIFGHKSKYGHFDEFIFNPEDINKLENILTYLKKCV